MLSAILLILGAFGGNVKEDRFYNVFINNFNNDVKNSFSALYPKYEKLVTSKKYNENCENIKKEYFEFCKLLVVHIYKVYKIKGLEKEELYNEQKQITSGFIESIF